MTTYCQSPFSLRALFTALLLTSALPRALAADARPPGKMAFQGFLTDGNGNPRGSPAAQNFAVSFKIYDAPTGGKVLWEEQQTVTIEKGHFSVVLGEGTLSSGTHVSDLSLPFAGDTSLGRYLGITVGSETEIAPRIQFLSAPYAHLARYATELVGSAGTSLLKAGDGKVGINLAPNAQPASTLEVLGTITATAFSGNGANISGLTPGQIPGLDASKITSGALATDRIPTTLTSEMTFGSSPSFTSRIRANGTVNSVGASSSFPAGFLVLDGTSERGALGYAAQDLNWSSSAKKDDIVLRATTGNLMLQNGSGNAALVIDKNNKVGIGTTTPKGKLHVVGGQGDQLWLESNAGTTPKGDAAAWRIYVSESAGRELSFSPSTSADPAHFPYATISRSNGAYSQSSDARLKRDIAPLDPVLPSVLKLRPVSYRFKSASNDSQKSIGFIAQEVEPLFPSTVSESAGYKTLSYADFGVIAIAALQEVSVADQNRDQRLDKLEASKSRVASLESQVAEMELELSAARERQARWDKRLKDLEQRLAAAPVSNGSPDTTVQVAAAAE